MHPILQEYQRMKSLPFGQGVILGADWGYPTVDLVCFSADKADDAQFIAMLANWRQDNMATYPRQEKITEEGTKRWVLNQLVNRPDRILFLVRQQDGGLVGHMGLSSFNPDDCSAEFDNMIKGDKSGQRGVMTDASNLMFRWAHEGIGIKRIWGRFFYDNFRVVALYHRAGFVPALLEPIRRVTYPTYTQWEVVDPHEQFDSFYATMEHYHK